MDEKFEVTYEVEDGYVGPSRPQRFKIDAGDIYAEDGEEELMILFEEAVRDDFAMKVSWTSKDRERFIEWGLKVAKRRREEEIHDL